MIGWTTAFLDLDAASLDRGVAFWQAVTGSTLSPTRGEYDEFATLVPPTGDAWLRVQRLRTGANRIHLDLHDTTSTGLETRTSPGGFTFCVVPVVESVKPAPVDWGGHASLVDQVALDIPARLYEAECTFWAGLTGWAMGQSTVREEFRFLERPTGTPLRILLQRLDDEASHVTAHLDLACTDVAAETSRHEGLGATVVRQMPWWTVMRDPVGSAYCLTSRTPR